MSSQPDHSQPYDSHVEKDALPEAALPEEHSVDTSWLTGRNPAETGTGGRKVLGWTLGIAAFAWIAFVAWTAGVTVGSRLPSAPELASWIAIAAGPLALLGLVWLMFGRTRRKEAEAFTRSVIEMRSEARSLESVLAVLRERIDDSKTELRATADQLMALGNEATARLGKTREQLAQGAEDLAMQGERLDRAAQSARVDIGVLLEDLPRAEATTMQMAQALRTAGETASQQASEFTSRTEALAAQAGEADRIATEASERLAARLAELDDQSQQVAARLGDVADSSRTTVDELLARTAEALGEVRSGISVQADAVTALVEQSAAQIGEAGVHSAQALRETLTDATGSLDGIAQRINEQDAASRQLVTAINSGLGEIENRFAAFADEGDHRAMAIGTALSQVRADLESIEAQSAASGQSFEGLSGRIDAVRERVSALSNEVETQLTTTIGAAEEGASRLLETSAAASPLLASARDAAIEAGGRLEAGAEALNAQHERLETLVSSVTLGVEGTHEQLAKLAAEFAQAEESAQRLTHETGPALVSALVQVKEAAAHAAERAREAIGEIIPQSSREMSDKAREALEGAVKEAVATQLEEVERVATRAVEAAQGATSRLTRHMLSIGQSAAALEAHMAETEEAERERSSENFARRVSLLIDSLHSASIDVGKILSDEVDDRAWDAYLKGDRGIFTRRAVRLLGTAEERALTQHYESDLEFRDSVNRFIHDFEAMIRRVTTERDGGPVAVTMMSSDVGKLYTALAPLAGSRR